MKIKEEKEEQRKGRVMKRESENSGKDNEERNKWGRKSGNRRRKVKKEGRKGNEKRRKE